MHKFLLWTWPYCVLSFLLCCSANLFGAVDGALSGKVLDAETAQPVTGIEVTYWNESYMVWKNDFTDADGEFTLTNLPDGIAEVTARPDVATGYAWNLPPGSNLVNVNEGQDKSNRFIALEGGALVTGYIKDPNGNPAGAVEYDYNGRMSGGWGNTDVNGRYQIRLPVGPNRICMPAGYNLKALPKNITITDINQNVDVNDMTVYSEQTGGQISGDVNNPDGYSKTGQFFIVAFEAGTVVDPNTWYTVKSVAGTELPEAGPFAITALPPDANYDVYLCVESETTHEIQSLVVRDSAFNVPVGTTGITLNYKSEGNTVSGRVENTNGQAVMGAAVLLTNSATGNFAGFGGVDPNGEYAIYNVPAGTYTATAVHSKYLNASTPVQVGGLDGLLGHWLMNDNADNTTVVDSSGNCNDGIAQQNTSALHTTGKIDGALTFNGTNDYVKLTYDQDGWTKSDSNPLITGWYGSVWYNGPNDYHFFYSNGNAQHATSADGLNWTDDTAHNPIVTTASVVMVWKEEDTWYMLYRSSEWGGNKLQIGLATAPAPGGPWTKNANNPVLSGAGAGSWEGNYIDPWGIMKVGSTYYLWYNNVSVTPRQTGLATSTDLIHWTRDPHNPIFGDVTKEIYCIHPFKYGDWYYMVADFFYAYQQWPQLRLYRDSNPTFYPNERQYLGTILSCTPGAWDSRYFDTPSVMTTNINRDSFPDSDIWLYYTNRDAHTHWKIGLAKTSLANLAAIKPRPEVNVPLFRLNDAISISLWAKQDKKHTGNYIGLLAKDGCYLLTINANKLRGYIGSSGWHYTTGTTDLAVDTWYHFVMTFDKNGDKKVRIYVNAVEEGTPATTIYGINIGDSEIRIGSYYYGSSANYFDGTIDNVMIFNNALSPSEIDYLYNGGDGIEPPFGASTNNNIVMSFVGEKEGADLNGDGFVNMLDFAKLADQWLQYSSLDADFNQDSKVDFADLVRVAENWLWQAIWYHD